MMVVLDEWTIQTFAGQEIYAIQTMGMRIPHALWIHIPFEKVIGH